MPGYFLCLHTPVINCRGQHFIFYFSAFSVILQTVLSGYMSRKFKRKRKEQEIADCFYDEVRRKENSAEKFFGKVGRGEISHETTEQWDE